MASKNKCHKCGKELRVGINWTKARKKCSAYVCKKCEYLHQKDYLRKPKNKRKKVEWTRKFISERRAFTSWLKSIPCQDCDRIFATVCMDFDHVRGKKKADIQTAVTHCWPWKRLAKEIRKCEIVCANCHRVRSQNRTLRKE